MTSPRRLTIPDLAADPTLLKRLIDGGETLFVEFKERDPKNGLGPTVASFANMLGGWLVIGVDDHGKVVGYEPPGTADLQDYMRDLLGRQVDPLPPFAATTVEVDGKRIGIVHVAESSDTPHITNDGVIYVRNPGGKQRVTDHRDILALARRGRDARDRAEARLYELPMIADAMRSPGPKLSDPQAAEAFTWPPLLQWIVRASPYTLSGAFAERALSAAAADHARVIVASLLAPGEKPGSVATQVDPRARGLHCRGGFVMPGTSYVDLAIDAGGVAAVRFAWHRERGVVALSELAQNTLIPLSRAVADIVGDLGGYGRAAVGLEVHGAQGLTVQWGSGPPRQLNAEHVTNDPVYVGGDLPVPATDDDVAELVSRWVRELARAAELAAWEPGPEPSAPTMPHDQPPA